MAQQIICDHCMSNVELGAQSCPYCGKRFVNTNPAGALPAHCRGGQRRHVLECACSCFLPQRIKRFG